MGAKQYQFGMGRYTCQVIRYFLPPSRPPRSLPPPLWEGVGGGGGVCTLQPLKPFKHLLLKAMRGSRGWGGGGGGDGCGGFVCVVRDGARGWGPIPILTPCLSSPSRPHTPSFHARPPPGGFLRGHKHYLIDHGYLYKRSSEGMN